MSAYTKLFQSIITSTLWRESPETKVVWVTMMAIADKNGIVEASVPGLAAISHVSIEECEAALNLFMSPDKWSRTPDNEGRRIAPVDGGWELLNHEKYRLKMTEDERKEYERVRKQRQRERARENMSQDVPDMSGTSPGQNETQGTFPRNVPHSEEEEEEKGEEEKETLPISVPESGKPIPKKRTTKPFVPPTLDECRAYAVEIGQPADDGEAYWYGKVDLEWTNNGKPMANWKTNMQSRKAAGLLKSQKHSDNGTDPPSAKRVY